VIVIGDASLRSHECARVVFRGLPEAELHAMIRMDIVVGDVFRFNRVSVREDYIACGGDGSAGNSGSIDGGGSISEQTRGGSTLLRGSLGGTVERDDTDVDGVAMDLDLDLDESKSKSKSKSKREDKTVVHKSATTTPRKPFTVVCDFYHPWNEPEPGRSFSRIARSSHPSHNTPHILMMEESNAIISTPTQIIEGLVRWFRQRDHRLSSSPFHRSWSSSLNALVHMDTTSKRRRLRDLRTPNVISDLLVYVLSVDLVHQTDATTSDQIRRVRQEKLGRKRPRRWETNGASSDISGFAVLSDTCHLESKEPGHSMVFYFDESTSDFQTRLHRAYDRGAKVLITQLLTQNCLSLFRYRGRSADDDCGSIVLLPTPRTTVRAMGEDGGVAARYRAGGDDLEMLTPCSESFSLGAMMDFGEGGNGGPVVPLRTTVRLLMLVSVYFDELDVSLPSRGSGRQAWPNKPDLASMLVRSIGGKYGGVTEVPAAVPITPCSDSSSYEYRSATLTLSSMDSDSKDSYITVKAGSKIISTLCGSCHASSLFIEDGHGVEIALVSDILRGFINLNVPLEWTIQHTGLNDISDDDYDSVDSVYLPSLDF